MKTFKVYAIAFFCTIFVVFLAFIATAQTVKPPVPPYTVLKWNTAVTTTVNNRTPSNQKFEFIATAQIVKPPVPTVKTPYKVLRWNKAVTTTVNNHTPSNQKFASKDDIKFINDTLNEGLVIAQKADGAPVYFRSKNGKPGDPAAFTSVVRTTLPRPKNSTKILPSDTSRATSSKVNQNKLEATRIRQN